MGIVLESLFFKYLLYLRDNWSSWTVVVNSVFGSLGRNMQTIVFIYQINLKGLIHFGKDDLLGIATEVQSTREK